MAFDDPFNANNTNENFDDNNFSDGDPAAEFLEREKRELGDITGSSNALHSQSNGSISNGNEQLFARRRRLTASFRLFQRRNRVIRPCRNWMNK